MYRNNKVIVTICARGGSKGVPKKNIRQLLGKPLIWYTINLAKKLSWVDRIVLSTDDLKIKKISEDYGIKVPFLRPKYLATDKINKIPVIIHAIKTAAKIWNESYDICIDLDVTSPLKNMKDVDKTLKILVDSPKTKVVLAASHSPKNPYFNMVEQNKFGYIDISKKLKRRPSSRQDSPPVYVLNGGIWIAWVRNLFADKTYFTKQTRIYIMPEERAIDIDYSTDFDFIEYKLKKFN